MILRAAFYIIFFLLCSVKVWAQTPRFIFLDSLSYNLSPVSPAVVKSKGYVRTEGYSVQTKTRDTTMYLCFYYNTEGYTVASKKKLPDKDTISFSFKYDGLNRLINTRASAKTRVLSTEVADYFSDTVVTKTKFNWKGDVIQKMILHFNKQYQLINCEVLDSLDNVYETTAYLYDNNGLPVRATQMRGSRQIFDNSYEYSNKGNAKTVKVYEMFAGYKRLIEKIEYNSKKQLKKVISYNYMYGNKKFSAWFDYYDDGSLKSYEGVYHYNGFRFKQYYYHYND